MDPFSPPARYRVMDEDRFPDPFQAFDQNVVDDPVLEIGRKNFTPFGAGGNKADRAGVLGTGNLC